MNTAKLCANPGMIITLRSICILLMVAQVSAKKLPDIDNTTNRLKSTATAGDTARRMKRIRQTRQITSKQIADFEMALRPFFERKCTNEKHLARGIPVTFEPCQADLFFLARYWDHFSDSFKALYKRATSIPPEYLKYDSPGGKFTIIYTLMGSDAIDPEDLYHYGNQDGDWRVKQEVPNGIPDYVDEVAWAFDSAWSMEIDRFSFAEPLPYIDNYHTTNLYKVLICDQGYHFYGTTYPAKKSSDSLPGYSSHIEIRNNWDGWNLSEEHDYSDHPEKAVRITAAHEFFHAIQYATAWKVEDNIDVDDFTIGWLEGAAVLMEELAFDDINDYVQYLDAFFITPDSAMLTDTYDGLTEYKNVLITKYIYERATDTPAIVFFKAMESNNLVAPTLFQVNLAQSSIQIGTSWSQILHGFYTESYFTGERSHPDYFISDASRLDQWQASDDLIDSVGVVSKVVESNSMQTFAVSRSSCSWDTLHIAFIGDTSFGEGSYWAASVILVAEDGNADTVVSLPINEQSFSQADFASWSQYSRAIVIATNAHDSLARTAGVYFGNQPFTLPAKVNTPDAISKWNIVAQPAALVTLELYNMTGRRVASFPNDRRSNRSSLDQMVAYMRNADGNSVVPGMYLIVAEYANGAIEATCKAIGPTSNCHQSQRKP